MGRLWKSSFCFLLMVSLIPSMTLYGGEISGELKKWHTVTITFEGPTTWEQANPNPFLDYRLDVTFTHDEVTYTVPGFYAADGDAGNTGTTYGNKWRVYFCPDRPGEWKYEASFVHGEAIAIKVDDEGDPMAFDGESGSFNIESTDKQIPDVRARGRLRHEEGHYLRFAETGEYFLKGGADSPENFLAYYEFDQTYKMMPGESQRSGEAKSGPLHRYEPHAQDWGAGDPTWKDGKGKNIIGALNYLSSKGMNSVYFLTMNIIGDGKDVWPWTSHDERYRFDCSKLDQWEVVFRHMDHKGLMLHVITQETENDQLLDAGKLGPERKLYYRELIARMAHHPALVWNLGEENTNTEAQRKAFADYIRALDPYDHPIVVHTYPGQYDNVYEPLLGHETFDGPSLQMGNMKQTHSETIKWIDRSSETKPKWFVSLDEIGPANVGVKPDDDDYWHDDVRKHALWGNLMAGGAGCEWYFGYQYDHNDLNCEDWRSRDHMWDLTRIALDFFHENLPFHEMKHNDDLTYNKEDYCFAKPGEIYAIYLPNGGTTDLELEEGTYMVRWYNPREGGTFRFGSVKKLEGPGIKMIGDAPEDEEKDWVVLIENKE